MASTTIDNFVIINCGGAKIIAPTNNPDYQKFVKLQKERKLKEKYPHEKHMNELAAAWHTPEMLWENKDEKKYADGVLIDMADKDGELELPGDEAGEKMAKFIIKCLRKNLKRDAKLAKHSKKFSDNWNYEAELPVSLPKKQALKALRNGLNDRGQVIQEAK